MSLIAIDSTIKQHKKNRTFRIVDVAPSIGKESGIPMMVLTLEQVSPQTEEVMGITYQTAGQQFRCYLSMSDKALKHTNAFLRKIGHPLIENANQKIETAFDINLLIGQMLLINCYSKTQILEEESDELQSDGSYKTVSKPIVDDKGQKMIKYQLSVDLNNLVTVLQKDGASF